MYIFTWLHTTWRLKHFFHPVLRTKTVSNAVKRFQNSLPLAGSVESTRRGRSMLNKTVRKKVWFGSAKLTIFLICKVCVLLLKAAGLSLASCIYKPTWMSGCDLALSLQRDPPGIPHHSFYIWREMVCNVERESFRTGSQKLLVPIEDFC